MFAELTLTGPRAHLAAFQQTAQRQAQARLDELDEDSYVSRLVQRRILSLHASALWSGTEDSTTVTLTTTGYYAAIREAVETVQQMALAHGLPVQVRLEPEEGDAQARAEDVLSGLVDAD